MVTAITMGDAAGVGPELILRAHEQSLFSGPTVVIGDYSVLERCQKAIGTSCDLQRLSPEAAIGEAAEHTGAEAAEHAGYEGEKPAGAPIDAGGKEPPPRPLLVYDLGLLTGEEVPVGKVSAKTGEAAARYVEHATRLALAGHIDGFVTCPMNKEATRLALPEFTGHTELIAELCGAEEVSMMLASKRLIVSHVSTHVSLAEAISKVSRDRVLSVIRLTHEALSRLSSTSRLAVCGLNPHAGEGGAFGTEDAVHIAPAIADARAEGMDVRGPEAADTVFHRADLGEFDAVVCMYHDQGHIPMKTLDFDGGVNVTLGLPIVRTSVDHGTAFDIAWKGVASTVSLHEAYRFAQRLIGSPSRVDDR